MPSRMTSGLRIVAELHYLSPEVKYSGNIDSSFKECQSIMQLPVGEAISKLMRGAAFK